MAHLSPPVHNPFLIPQAKRNSSFAAKIKKGVRNMRSTFNILFYVNKSKEKQGIVPVMGRVTINGTQSQFSCKKSIPLDMWDVKGNCAKGRSKEALQLNRDLDNIKAQIIKHYQHLSDREAFVTAEMVRNSYQGFGSEYETLLNAFDKDILCKQSVASAERPIRKSVSARTGLQAHSGLWNVRVRMWQTSSSRTTAARIFRCWN